jgi:hypothetical protein
LSFERLAVISSDAPYSDSRIIYRYSGKNSRYFGIFIFLNKKLDFFTGIAVKTNNLFRLDSL